MKYLSICSGIEAASAAWHQFGWQPIAFAEIEPFPSAVLAHHYPNVPNLGDMTRLPEMILRGEVEAPDLLVGGTPCQAFSVAGLRNSLDDNRGRLTLTFIRIADAIDHVRRTRGEPPCIIVWENVPGVLSTSDNAFGCFLGALAGEDGELDPSGKRWTNAGAVFGPQRTVAWRILDAQYFRVAQRRRRVFVVASARDGFNPAEVLFEFDGVRRDSPPSREARQSVATSAAAGAGSGSAHAFKVRGGVEREDGSRGSQNIGKQAGKGYLGSDELAFTVASSPDQWLFQQQQTIAARMVAFGEYVEDGTASAMKARDYKDATDLVAQPIHYRKSRRAQSVDDHETWVEDDATNTLNCFDVGDVRAVDVVAQPIAWTEELTASVDVAGTIQRGGAGGRHDGVAVPVGVDIDNTNITGDCSGNILAGAQMRSNKGMGVMQAVAPALTASNDPSRSPQSSEVTQQVGAVYQAAMQVRRLTPVECERLQGFPDGYTNIPWRGKPNAPDGPRYKALGNSMAVPCMAWIGNRINQHDALH